MLSLQSTEAHRLIFVTNRGPVEHSFGPNGVPIAKRGSGGVVSGLLAASCGRPVTWISVAMSDADRALAQAGTTINAAADVENLTARLVYVAPKTYRRYYDRVSNKLLWFVQHGLPHRRAALSESIRRDWSEAYVAVNAAIADAVVAELRAQGEDTPVILHDYHLYLAAAMIRAEVPQARLLHFTHIPWPSPDDWALVPDEIQHDIYAGLAACDVLGFQTPRDARNFLEGARWNLSGAVASSDPDELIWRWHRTEVRAYPIALTPEAVRTSASMPEAEAAAARIRKELHLDKGRKLIVRVDRVEPAKNIVRGFQAYERLLVAHPEWHRRVVFLALLVPSREGLRFYRNYAERVRAIVDRINQRFGTPDWQPVVTIYGNDRARALACMRDFDVLLVNSRADGMNLVAKEGGILNRRNGVIVLSHRAGAYSQLRHGVLGISPASVRDTTDALLVALTMPEAKRALLARHVREVLENEDANKWLGRQLAHLMRAGVSRVRKSLVFNSAGTRQDKHAATRQAWPIPAASRMVFDVRDQAAHTMSHLPGASPVNAQGMTMASGELELS
jgi:trehalose 6-phosphate synthase